MSLPGMFVEYLITGALGLSWMWYLLGLLAPNLALPLDKLNAGHVTLAAPLAYVLGMWIDLIGKRLIRFIAYVTFSVRREQNAIANRALPDNQSPGASPEEKTGATESKKKEAKRKYTLAELSRDTSDDAQMSAKVRLFAESKDLGEKYDVRRSRERVARGAFANVVLVWATGPLFLMGLPISPMVWTLGGAIGAGLAFFVWYRFAKLSRKFRDSGLDALHDLAADPEVKPKLPTQELVIRVTESKVSAAESPKVPATSSAQPVD